MTPQEEARELVNTFYQTTPNEAWFNPPLGSSSMDYKAWGQAKECALIAVDKIINVAYWNSVKDFYREVKREIEKL